MTSTATTIICTGTFNTPGPGAYMPPDTFGTQSPRFSIKNKYEGKPKPPGPGYNDCPNSIGKGKKYSFGVKHKEFEKMKTPGPNYMPPQFGSDVPKSSFHSRHFEGKTEITPGPGQYIDPKLFQSDLGGPKITMKSRAFPPDGPESCSPGPGKFNPDYSKVLPSIQKNTLSPRYPERKVQPTPGPATYEVKCGLTPRNISFHQKHWEPKADQTPGPAAYVPERHAGENSPRFTIRPRCDIPVKRSGGEYQLLPERFGNEGRKVSLSSRPAEREIQASPGPNYVPPPFGSDAHKSSFHSRSVDAKRDITPGPNFVPGDDRLGKRYTIKGRNFPPERKDASPGPGNYKPDYDKVLPSAPKTGIRVQISPRKKAEPGPGFIAAPPLPSGPKYTIGHRDPHAVMAGSG